MSIGALRMSSPVQAGALATAQCGVSVASFFHPAPPAMWRAVPGYYIMALFPAHRHCRGSYGATISRRLSLLDPCFTRLFARLSNPSGALTRTTSPIFAYANTEEDNVTPDPCFTRFYPSGMTDSESTQFSNPFPLRPFVYRPSCSRSA